MLTVTRQSSSNGYPGGLELTIPVRAFLGAGRHKAKLIKSGWAATPRGEDCLSAASSAATGVAGQACLVSLRVLAWPFSVPFWPPKKEAGRKRWLSHYTAEYVSPADRLLDPRINRDDSERSRMSPETSSGRQGLGFGGGFFDEFGLVGVDRFFFGFVDKGQRDDFVTVVEAHDAHALGGAAESWDVFQA